MNRLIFYLLGLACGMCLLMLYALVDLRSDYEIINRGLMGCAQMLDRMENSHAKIY